MPFVIIGILVAVALIILYLVHTFRLEKVEVEDKKTLEQEEPSGVDASTEMIEKEAADLAELAAIAEASDVQEKKSKEQYPYAGAMEAPKIDPLCDLTVGIANDMECQRALSEAQGPWAVVWFDLDRFRFVNSIKGMSIGDYVLTNLAQSMREIFPDGALCTRISADHFSVTLPLPDPALLSEYSSELKRSCDKIRSGIGVKASMHICMGACVTGVGDYASDYDVMLEKANIARHCLKGSKSESYGIYNDSMATSFLFGESALDDFGDNQYDEGIIPYFVPQSDIIKNRIVASQAIMRWDFEEVAHKDRPIDCARARLPSNGRRLIYHVCRAISRWRKSGKEVLPTLVPLPPTELFRKDIDEFVLRCVHEFQIQIQEIVPVVDITSFLIAREIAQVQVKKLIDIGCKIAVDGNSYSGIRLSSLEDSGVSYVKISPIVTAGIAKNAERLSFLSDFSEKIKAMGMQPIFEGINENAQMRAIERIGGALVDGRYAGRAVNGDEFSQVLKEYIEKQRIISAETVIMDDETARRGEFNI